MTGLERSQKATIDDFDRHQSHTTELPRTSFRRTMQHTAHYFSSIRLRGLEQEQRFHHNVYVVLLRDAIAKHRSLL